MNRHCVTASACNPPVELRSRTPAATSPCPCGRPLRRPAPGPGFLRVTSLDAVRHGSASPRKRGTGAIGSRHLDAEARPVSRRRCHIDRELEQSASRSHDRQPQPESPRPIALRVVELVELLEDALVFGLGNADAGVLDADHPTARIRMCRGAGNSARIRTHRDLSVRRVLDRVLQQVSDDAGEEDFIRLRTRLAWTLVVRTRPFALATSKYSSCRRARNPDSEKVARLTGTTPASNFDTSSSASICALSACNAVFMCAAIWRVASSSGASSMRRQTTKAYASVGAGHGWQRPESASSPGSRLQRRRARHEAAGSGALFLADVERLLQVAE